MIKIIFIQAKFQKQFSFKVFFLFQEGTEGCSPQKMKEKEEVLGSRETEYPSWGEYEGNTHGYYCMASVEGDLNLDHFLVSEK